MNLVNMQEGRRIEVAIENLLRQGKKTKDIGGKLTTLEFTELVAKCMY